MTEEIIKDEITVEKEYPYVSLHNHTTFSIFQSLIKPTDLFKRAKELGQKAIAVTDKNSLAGIWDSLKAAKENGIRLIVGLEISFVDDVADKESKLRNIVLIAKNAKGYENLLKVSKVGFDNFIIARKNPCPRIDWNILNDYKEGLLCITGDTSGIISRLLNDKKFDEAEKVAQKLKDIFGDDLALELQPNALKRTLGNYNEIADQVFTNKQLKKIGEKLNIRLIAANNSYYTNPEQYKAHDVWLAMGSGQPVKSGNRLSFNVNDFYIKSGKEVHYFFERTYGTEFADKLLKDTVSFAKKCEKPEWVDPKFSNPSGKELPIFPVKNQEDYAEFTAWLIKQKDQSLEEDVQYLRFKTIKNYKSMILSNPKYKDVVDIYKKRIYEELDVLESQGFSGYMLIVGDFLEWARKNGVSVGPGRGCINQDALILTENGYKKIIDVKIGDKVYTHTGELQVVLNKFEYDINEKCLEIHTTKSDENIIFTKDHKVFGSEKLLKTEDFINNYSCIKKITTGFNKPDWFPISKLAIGDGIFTTFPNRIINNKKITYNLLDYFVCKKDECVDGYILQKVNIYSKFTTRSICRTTKLNFEKVRICKNGENIDDKTLNSLKEYLNKFNLTIEQWRNIPKFKFNKIKQIIDFDEDFAYFLGRWMGDGCFHGRVENKLGISIAFNSNDNFGIEKISNYCTKLGFNAVLCHSKTSNGSTLTITSKYLVNLFKKIFPDYNWSYTKHFPIGFRTLPNNLLEKIINGLFDSDGTQKEDGGKKYIKSTSYRMSHELKEALLFLTKSSTIYTATNNHRYGIKNHMSYNCMYSDSTELNNIGYYSRIQNITEIDCNKVYDITVDKDNSYLTSNYVVHNSAGGSLIAYLLGIHVADPIKYQLVFARFHSKFKGDSPPDIDSDLSTAERYKVEQYLIEKYGSSHVAHISNYNGMTPKPYVKAIARTFMYGGDRKTAVQIGADLADTIPSEAKTVSHMFEYSPLLNEYSKKYTELKEYADSFSKNPIAVATHAAAIVISKRELFGLIPVRRDKEGSLSLEYEKERAEENGMVKMDLLGLTTLDIIDNTYKLIKQVNKFIPYDNFDYESYDEKAYNLISKGDTFCIFQFGTSGGTIELCKKYFPKNIEDLAIITTLARPAAKEIRDDFFKVKNGEKQVELLHPLLERAFKQTLGFALYDESLLILAEDVAGWDLHSADRLRKLTKEKGKNPAKAKKWKDDFIEGCIKKNNLSLDKAEKIWDEIVQPFSRYSFNKSHAVLYSMISYHTAYLKAHYPLEFLVANLMQEVNSGAKIAKDNISRIKEEIKKQNINITPPNINTSGPTYTILNEYTLATGLNALKYMGSDAVPEILAKRPFKSFEDFLSRTDSSKVKAPAIQALAASGALAEFNMPRKQMFLYAADYKKKLQVWLKKKPEKRGEFSYPWPDTGEWTIPEINALEQYYIGEGLTGSKQEVYKGFFHKNHHNFSEFIKMLPPPPDSMDEKEKKNYQIKVNFVQGVVKSVFEFKIKKEKSKLIGQTMAKLTIEDPYGNQLGVTFFPEKWEYFKERIKDINSKFKFEIGMGLSMVGNLQWYDGNISIIFDELQNACPPPQLPSDLKAKKTESVKKAKVDEIVDENMDRNELLEEIEDELAENGFADLDDEDEEESTTW